MCLHARAAAAPGDDLWIQSRPTRRAIAGHRPPGLFSPCARRSARDFVSLTEALDRPHQAIRRAMAGLLQFYPPRSILASSKHVTEPLDIDLAETPAA